MGLVKKQLVVIVAVYGMARTSLMAARKEADFFCWCSICCWSYYCTLFFCLSLCWLVLCLIYTVLSLMILSVLSFSWFCGPIKDYNYDMLKFLWTTLSSHLQINISMHFFSLWLQKVSDFNFSLKKGFNFNNN